MQMIQINVKIKAIHGKNPKLPQYQTQVSAGADVYACPDEQLTILPGETVAVPTGLCIEIPSGYEGQIRPRSGLALKYNIGLINSPGTIDADYRGEVKVLLTNFGKEPFTVSRGDRIAQLVIAPVIKAEFIEVEEITETGRGAGGFGHTGV